MPLPPKAYPKQYDDRQWKQAIQLANEAFNGSNPNLAFQHYLKALFIAKQLFTEFQDTQPLPDALTPVLVISYLNLAHAWLRQGNQPEQQACLLEVYEYLVGVLEAPATSTALRQQVYQGLSKVYFELCVCLEKANDLQALAQIHTGFSLLTNNH